MKMIIIFVLFILGSCKINVGTNENEQFKVIPINGIIDFATVKKYVLTPSCLRCHSWADDENSVQQRVIAGEPNNSILYQNIKSGTMPPTGALPSRQVQLVERYIMSLKVIPPPEIDSTFKSVQFHLVKKSCLACHNDSGTEISFEGYENIKMHANEMIDILDIGESEGTPMPPIDSYGNRKAPVPTTQIVEAFRGWIDEGMLNN